MSTSKVLSKPVIVGIVGSTIKIDYEMKSIKGFDKYKVDTNGEVWSPYNNKWGTKDFKKMKPSRLIGHYYPRVTLKKENCKYYRLVSRLVAESFIPNLEDKPYVLHGDGNIFNNKVENLRWGTQKENMEDMIDHGTRMIGEKSNTAKLNVQKVKLIRLLYSFFKWKQHSIAKLWKISQSTVSQIVLRNTWNHI